MYIILYHFVNLQFCIITEGIMDAGSDEEDDELTNEESAKAICFDDSSIIIEQPEFITGESVTIEFFIKTCMDCSGVIMSYTKEETFYVTNYNNIIHMHFLNETYDTESALSDDEWNLIFNNL